MIPRLHSFLIFACFALLSTLSCRAEVMTAGKQTFRVETLAEGLDQPWGLEKLPDGRFLVTEKKGNLRFISPDGKVSTPIQNVPEVAAIGQGGLLDVRLHPDYEKNGWVYLAYSKAGPGGAMTTIVRGKLRGDSFTDVETIYEPPAEDYARGGVHFGCRIVFDGKGYLYFSIGDRGSAPDKNNFAQNLSHAAGKIHRLHDDGRIPEDNPFVKTPGARPSIWTLGNRNVQGLAFQPGTERLWASEHGPRGGDELNIIRKGLNYGWPVISYGINYDGSEFAIGTHREGMEQPIVQWTPSLAVCGMDFYRGDKFPGWKGNLFMATLAGQRLVRMKINGEQVAEQQYLLEGTGRMRDVRCFDDGFVYLIYDIPGKMVRLVPVK